MASLLTTGMHGLIPALAGLGTVVQILVLGALLFASIVCWGIIVYKIREFRAVRHYNARFQEAFEAANDFAFIAAAARRFSRAPAARLFRAAYQHLETASASGSPRRPMAEGDLPVVSPLVLEQARRILHVRQAEEIEKLEHGLPFLATTASVTPFVGLLGTVWGIMQAFHAIGHGGGASLAIVGPGISEALIATAAGLAAAIPAVIAYNHYLNRLRRIEGELQSFVEDLMGLFQLSLPQESSRIMSRTPSQR